MTEVPHTVEGSHACENAPGGTGDHEVDGATRDGCGTGCDSSTAAPTVAAAAGAMTCEGLAELSVVPSLLRDESIGAVVLAAATAAEEVEETGPTASIDGFGVPEMTIPGRRLNREVRKGAVEE